MSNCVLLAIFGVRASTWPGPIKFKLIPFSRGLFRFLSSKRRTKQQESRPNCSLVTPYDAVNHGLTSHRVLVTGLGGKVWILREDPPLPLSSSALFPTGTCSPSVNTCFLASSFFIGLEHVSPLIKVRSRALERDIVYLMTKK